jgi:hypothetical protein
MADSVTEMERTPKGRKLPDHVQRAVDRATSVTIKPKVLLCMVCEKKMTSFDPAAPQRRSPHFIDQSPRTPTAQAAKRQCPYCRWLLCNNHSRAASIMKNFKENLGKRVCSNCHTHMPEETFISLERK